MPSTQSKTLVAMSLQLGVAVAVPTALLAYFGNMMDISYGTGNLFLISGLILAVIMSFAFVWQIIRLALEKLGHEPPRLFKKKKGLKPE